MTSKAERQAADVGYTGDKYELAGSASAVVAAIPDAWKGRYVDFSFVDPAATTNIAYVLFGSADTIAASISPGASAIDGTTKAMTAIAAGAGSHIQIPHGTVRPVRIPLTGVTFFSHIEGAATGRLKMTLSTGDGN
jgi:hypothetical protein